MTPRRVVVYGPTGRAYLCPTVKAVDQHIDKLRRRIADSVAKGNVRPVRFWRDDIDVLLDRRAALAAERQPV